ALHGRGGAVRTHRPDAGREDRRARHARGVEGARHRPAKPEPRGRLLSGRGGRGTMTGRFSPRRTVAVAHKEVRHILRDPLTMGFALGLPLVLVAFFGYAIDLDVRHIPV